MTSACCHDSPIIQSNIFQIFHALNSFPCSDHYVHWAFYPIRSPLIANQWLVHENVEHSMFPTVHVLLLRESGSMDNGEEKHKKKN